MPRSFALLCVLGLVAPGVLSQAMPPPESEAHVLYDVVPGDNLESIAARYLVDRRAIDAVARLNRLTSTSLLPAHRTLLLPREQVRHQPVTATVTRLGCAGAIAQLNDGGVALKLGDVLNQGDVVRSPAGCQVTLSIPKGGLVSLPTGAIVRFKRLQANELEPSPEVQLELLDGRLGVNVDKRGGRDAPFQVRTPTSVAGVRGTEFRMSFGGDKFTRVEVLSGTVGARGLGETAEQQATAGQGIVVDPQGRAGSPEQLPTGARLLAADAVGDGWRLRFSTGANGNSLLLARAEVANPGPQRLEAIPGDASVSAPGLGAEAVSHLVAVRTPGGLQSEALRFEVCEGYRREGERRWRCNVRFDLDALVEPFMTIERDEGATRTVVFSGRMQNRMALVRGLPVGSYRWTLLSLDQAGQTQTQEGNFELIATAGL